MVTPLHNHVWSPVVRFCARDECLLTERSAWSSSTERGGFFGPFIIVGSDFSLPAYIPRFFHLAECTIYVVIQGLVVCM